MNDRHLSSQLERLIDGELSPAELRTLVSSLDEEPELWRRCALTFIEAQAYSQEMPVLRRSLELPQAREMTRVPPRTKPGDNAWLTLLAVAASFLLAFGLGLIAPTFFSRGRQDSIANGNFYPSAEMPLAQASSPDLNNLRNIGNVQLVVDGGDPSQSRQVPVFETQQDLSGVFADSAPSIGPDLVELLRRHGYEVEQEQRYVPAALDDGRQMIVPLEGYQLTPVGWRY